MKQIFLHELRNDEYGLFAGAYSVELEQLGMPQTFHDLGFGEEVRDVCSARFELFDSNWSVVVPSSFPDLKGLI